MPGEQGELPGQALPMLEPLLICSLFKGLLEIQKKKNPESPESLNVSMGKVRRNFFFVRPL